METEILEPGKRSRRAIPEISSEALLLFRRIKEMKVGETVSYEELSGIIGLNVQDNRHYLDTARKKALVEEGIVTEAVWGKGIKRLDDESIARIGDSVVRHIRSSARKGRLKLSCVKDFGALTNEAKIKHNMGMSLLGAMMVFTKGKMVERIEHQVAQNMEQIPTAKLVELFKK